jgi:hypothetical protein
MRFRADPRSVACDSTEETRVTAMTQPLDEIRLDDIGFVDEPSPTTSAIVILGYN